MPTLKKRSGKTTITLYAQEERQIKGAIDVYRFTEVNGDEETKKLVEGMAIRSAALLKKFQPPPPKPKETQGELIEAEEKQDPNWKPMTEEHLDMGDDKPKPF